MRNNFYRTAEELLAAASPDSRVIAAAILALAGELAEINAYQRRRIGPGAEFCFDEYEDEAA